MQDKTQSSRNRQILKWAVSILFVLSLLTFSFLNVLDPLPNISIPTPRMPNPNARTFFLKAVKLVKDEQKIDIATSRAGRFAKIKMGFSPRQKAILIQENAPALQTLRQGFAYPYWETPARSFNTLLPHYAKFREMARLLRLEVMAKEDKGDWVGALNSELDTLRLGEMIPHGSTMIGSLVGDAIKNIGLASTENILPHLTAAQALTAIPEVQRICSTHVPWADTLQEEKWTGQASLMEIFRKPRWQEEMMHYLGNGPNGPPVQQMVFFSRGTVMHNYTQYMDQCIAAAKQPYGNHAPAPLVPDDPINIALAGNMMQGRNQEVQTEAHVLELVVQLALRAYKAEHGTYPASLTQLVPKYLARLPEDPTASVGTFSYSRIKDDYTLSEQIALPTPVNGTNAPTGK